MARNLKDKILNLYNSKTNKIVLDFGKKLNKPKTQKESKDDIIKNIRNLFKLQKENKAIKDKTIVISKTFLIR